MRCALILLPTVVAILLVSAVPATAAENPPSSGVDESAVPQAARPYVGLITELTGQGCPELPPSFVVAQVQAESGWDPDLRTGDAVGLLQVSQRTWVAAGGGAWPDPSLTDPSEHLRIVVPWLCSTLRAAAGYLATTPKDVGVLDAMLVCHIAGCRRVTGSASGIPAPGEAGCAEACSTAIRRYIDAVHDLAGRYSTGSPAADDREKRAPRAAARAEPAAPQTAKAAPPKAAPQKTPQAAAAWTGGATGCTRPDPVRAKGCLTGATEHGLNAAKATFGSVIRSVGCWDAHLQNPRSDHPKGRACDLFTGPAGRFATGTNLDDGWRIAHWFETNAAALKVKYVIWQGRYWDPSVRDDGTGWGRRYTGGGVYDTSDPTGGHYDHLHISFSE